MLPRRRDQTAGAMAMTTSSTLVRENCERPMNVIDLRNYVDTHRSVRADLAAGRTRDAFTHYLTIGRNQGLALSSEQEITEQQANALFLQTANHRLPTASRARQDFTCDGPPSFSVVMVLCNGFERTLLALARLRANHPGPMELILVDNGSTDETTTLSRYVEGARRLRFDVDIGYRACMQRGAELRHLGHRAVPEQRRHTDARRDRRGAEPRLAPMRALALSAASWFARMDVCFRRAASSGATVWRATISATPRRQRRRRTSSVMSISVRATSCSCAPPCCANLKALMTNSPIATISRRISVCA